MKWSRGEYEILLYQGAGEVRSTVAGATLGRTFGVHRAGKRKSYYAVTHIPTGCRVSPLGGFGKQTTAKRYAERILPLTDWATVTKQNAGERFDAPLLTSIAEGCMAEETVVA